LRKLLVSQSPRKQSNQVNFVSLEGSLFPQHTDKLQAQLELQVTLK
jgi:hypothetical protein